MNIAVRIQHHPSRAPLADRLARSLEDFPDIQVIADPGGSHTDAWRSHRACLNTLPADATHMLVVQDDALPVRDFKTKLERAIVERPNSVLLVFTPGFGRERKAMAEATRARRAFWPFTPQAYVPTVCIAYPRQFVEDILAWAEHGRGRRDVPMRGADDGIVSRFCRHRRLFPLMLVPSICDHDQTVTPIGKGQRSGPHRRAAML